MTPKQRARADEINAALQQDNTPYDQRRPLVDELNENLHRIRCCAGGAEVVLCTIDQGGHTWPGGKVPVYLGKTTTAINLGTARALP